MKIVVRRPPLPLLVAGIVLKVPVSKVKEDAQGRRVPDTPQEPPKIPAASASRKLAKPPVRATEYATTSPWLRDRAAK